MLNVFRRGGLAALTFVLAAACIIAFSQPVHAGGDYSLYGMVHGTNGDGTVDVGDTLYITMADLKAEMGDGIETCIDHDQVYVECVFYDPSNPGVYALSPYYLYEDSAGRFCMVVPEEAAGLEIMFYTDGTESGLTGYSANSERFKVKPLSGGGGGISGEYLSGFLKGQNKDGTFYSGDEAYVTMDLLKARFPNFETLYNEKKVTCNFYAGTTKLEAFYKSGRFYYTIHPSRYGQNIKFVVSGAVNGETQSIPVSTYIDFTVDKSGKVTVTGKTNKANTFQAVKVDGGWHVLPSSQVGKQSISFTFSVTDEKKYSVGAHSLEAIMSDSSVCESKKTLPVSIYKKPSLSAKWFETEAKYLVMTPGSFSASYGNIYIDYRKGKKGKWSTQWGPFSPNSPGKISKLSPGSTYQVRAYYVKNVSGTYYIGPVSKTITIKTGPKKKPAIKSVSISKAKVKKVKVLPKTYWDSSSKSWKTLKGYTTYETTYKVTIKFKKKPGIAGIEVYAGGVTLPKFIKGNKKAYTATFTVGGKAKGKKTVFKIRTKGNKTYGAWSPFYKSKKVKIK